MDKCKWIVNEDGSMRPFDANERAELNNLQIEWCKEGQRVLLICTKLVGDNSNIDASMGSTSTLETAIQATDDFCVLGMLGIIDKPREGIDEVIGICRRAGIRVFMVTGDFAVTAAAIASQIGIFTNKSYDTLDTLQRNHIPEELQLDKKGRKTKKEQAVSILVQPRSLLLKPPRRVGIDHLFDRKLLSFGYFFLGALEAVFSMFLFFLYLYVHGGFAPSEVFLAFDKWAPGYQGRYINDTVGLNDLVYSAQTVTFVALVMMQTFGNLLITRAHYLSLWSSFPLRKNHRNLWLFGAQGVSIVLTLAVIYIPFINDVFLTRPIPFQYYFYPVACSVVFIVLDEIRKLLVRKNVSFFVKTAW